MGREPGIRLERRHPLAARHVRPVGHVRSIRAAVERVAPQLARDARRRPADRPKQQTVGPQIGEPISLIGREVGIS
jgi:hypothetical protein